MYHYIYKITNTLNNKFYYGKHSTINLEDNYMGSGYSIKNAIKKYGKLNFVKEILCFCNSESDVYELEELVVTEEEVKNNMCYNRTIGGDGFKSGKDNPMSNLSVTMRKKFSDEKLGNKNPMFGKTGKNHFGSKAVLKIDKNTNEIIAEYASISDAAKDGYTKSRISECCLGYHPHHKKFIWKFKNKVDN